MSIELQPITFDWLNWKSRYEFLQNIVELNAHQSHRLMAAISEWNSITVRWFQNLDQETKSSAVDLLAAEIDALWDVADPAAHVPTGHFPHPPSEDDRLDFRQRYYVAQSLLSILEQIRIPRAATIRHLLNQLEIFVTERRGWLP